MRRRRRLTWAAAAVLLAAGAFVAQSAARDRPPDRVWARTARGELLHVALEPEGAELRTGFVRWAGLPMLDAEFRRLTTWREGDVWRWRTLGLPGEAATYERSGRTAAGASGTWEEYGRVVATYVHRVERRDGIRIVLLADGSIVGRPGATWRRDGRTLWLSWPDPKAPGGAWLDRCELSEDEETYEGVNQEGTRVSGEPWAECG